jgi:hypothetical protein
MVIVSTIMPLPKVKFTQAFDASLVLLCGLLHVRYSCPKNVEAESILISSIDPTSAHS